MKSFLIKKLIEELLRKEDLGDKANRWLMYILIPIIIIGFSLTTVFGWLQTDIHLVSEEEKKSAMKAGKPIPKSYWITKDKKGNEKKLEFQTEDLAKKHYDFQKDATLSSMLFDALSGGAGGSISDGQGGGGNYTWDASKGSLPPYHHQGNLYTSNGGFPGQCTWYATDRVLQLYGIRLPAMGNGGDWANSARRLGYTVDKNARVGDAVCFPGGCNVKYVHPTYGHIAILEKINSDGSIVCSEFWGSVVDFKLHYTTYSAYEAGQLWYIHFKK